eukprot:NODE_1092_length_609_cov_425.100000_g1019_i0.p1 GENE.NODE_1092_length_609_cov_425.100000_g1019_i0~~NODE_1092_length_609_cov_425.100000_g1019_i0.p1  ORF type:complete len:146 (-),score=36.02 NODE_1092_length_609_cov_425.100000_g1019_i0:85-522(-)
MTTRLRKNRKKRGHVSAGHGRVGKHRKHPSGRGNAGGQHHHRINFDKYHPGYFGKVGMRYFHWKKSTRYQKTINLENIFSLLPPKTAAATATGDKKPVLNLLNHGYVKLLGKGTVPQGIIVKGRTFTRIAEKKIKEAGGACVVVA